MAEREGSGGLARWHQVHKVDPEPAEVWLQLGRRTRTAWRRTLTSKARGFLASTISRAACTASNSAGVLLQLRQVQEGAQ